MNTIRAVIIVSIFACCSALEGYCGPYLGDVCKKYIDTSSRFVWYNITTGKIENENITKGLWQEMIVGLREPCRSSAEVGYIQLFVALLLLLSYSIVFRNCYVNMHSPIVLCLTTHHYPYVTKTVWL